MKEQKTSKIAKTIIAILFRDYWATPYQRERILAKEQQEKKSLIKTKDSFKKIIVVKDDIKLKRDDNGITTMGIFDFLLNENSLDM